MKGLVILVYLFIILGFQSNAQINRVYNPSFEQISQCPNSNWQAYYADGWSGLDTSFFGAGLNCNPYLYNTCSTNFGLPSGYILYQYPHSGNSLTSFTYYLYDSINGHDDRVVLHGKILPLQTNYQYCTKYFIVLSNPSMYATNQQSVYFDNGSLCTSDSCIIPRTWVIPQIVNQSVISDTLNWSKIEGVFTASGSESYINLGNFKSYNQVQKVQVNNSLITNESIYLIDDISVVDYNLSAFAGTDALIANGDSVYIGRPNEIGPECRWWANGTALNDSSLGFWAKPTQPTQYVLQQKICGNIKYDTVFINVGHVGLDPLSIGEGQEVRLAPNPSNGSFIISSSQATYSNVIIYSIDGKEVYNSKLIFTKGNANFDLDLPNGVYYVKLIGSSGVASQKLVISK